MLLSGCAEEFHPIIYAGITAKLIHKLAINTRRAAGPSVAGADQWRQMCVSFQNVSSNLYYALASVARRLASQVVNPSNLHAFLANRPIPLDKCSGIHPIGIGEVMKRITPCNTMFVSGE